MSRYPNLTDDDVELLKALPLTAGAMVVTLGTTGVVEAGREMLAAARVVATAADRFTGNPLVAHLHAALHDRNQLGVGHDGAPTLTTRDPMVAMAAFVDQLDRALEVLDTKVDPADAHGYKQWIMACARASAEAAKEGGRFGLGGKRVSEEEAAYLAHLGNRLGLPPPPES